MSRFALARKQSTAAANGAAALLSGAGLVGIRRRALATLGAAPPPR